MNFDSKELQNLHDDKSFQTFRNKQFRIRNLKKKSQTQTSVNIQMGSESDDEFLKEELEDAVNQYRKNKQKAKYNSITEETKQESIKFNKNQNLYPVKVDDNGNASKDMLELINYFLKNKKNQNKKAAVIDYEKQGAIPKRTVNDSNEHKKFQSKTPEIKQKNQVKGKNGKNIHEIIYSGNHVDNKSIVKINNEICSKPFFYVVPDNPSPNFFFCRGSYYIIPKMPTSLQKETIIFHPERTTSTCEPDDKLFTLEKKFNGIPLKGNSLLLNMNDLGKKSTLKEDSHLNIGPSDAKLAESVGNLETNYGTYKIYEKAFMNSSVSNALSIARREEQKLNFTDKAKENCSETDENCLENEEIFNSLIAESKREQELVEKLMTEFSGLDRISASDIVNNYLLYDSENLEFFNSEPYRNKLVLQLERMVSALPESRIGDLLKKIFQFRGDENVINTYIKETERINRISQRVTDIQFILPDADPDFLRKEVDNLSSDDDAFNALTEQLLDSKTYPKISEDNNKNKKKRLWLAYVMNFTIKNFILWVPNAQDFAGPDGDSNKADIELILTFLISRYPSESRNFLKRCFMSNNSNLTKTCAALSKSEAIRLSESSFENEDFNEAFLKEVCYIDHRTEIDSYLKEMKERKEMEIEEARLNDFFLSCPLCTETELVASEVIACSEGHIFCKECIERYIFVQYSDGIYKFSCPSDMCTAFFCYTDLEDLLPVSVLLNITKRQQTEEIISAKVDGLESCSYCEFAYIPNPEDKVFKCQNIECLKETCRKCKEISHIPLRCEEIERPIDVEARKKIEETMTEQLVRTCPKCFKKFVRIDGCNKITCPCGAIICYNCRKIIIGYNHFEGNSPEGKCPLFSNDDVLQVFEAGIQARNRIIQDNSDVRFVHDPTINKN